jgi:3-hydroxybutyrate dehydrogenase
MAEPLEGRTALVTGAGRGIGRAVALALASAGARLLLAGRTVEPLREVAREVVAAGGLEPSGRVLDVADLEATVAALDRLHAEGVTVDVLVNNAGFATAEPLARTDLALWQRHLTVNATAAFLFTRAFVPGMLARGWGRVVNIASTAGLAGAPYIAAYAASKHALLGLTRAVAAETAGSGVTVNAICSGYVATDIVWNGARRISEKTGKPFDEAVAAMARFNPSGVLIQPEAVAAAVLELCADAAADRTGEAVALA